MLLAHCLPEPDAACALPALEPDAACALPVEVIPPCTMDISDLVRTMGLKEKRNDASEFALCGWRFIALPVCNPVGCGAMGKPLLCVSEIPQPTRKRSSDPRLGSSRCRLGTG